MMNYELKELSFGETISKAFNIYLDNFIALALISLACNVPGLFVLLINTDSSTNTLMIYALIMGVISLISGLLSTGISVDLVSRRYQGKEVSVAECYANIKPRLPALLGMTLMLIGLLALVMIVLALIFGVIVAIFFSKNMATLSSNITSYAPLFIVLMLFVYVPIFLIWIRLSLASQVLIVEGAKAKAAIKRSWQLTKDQLGKIVSFYLVLGMIQLLLYGVNSVISQGIMVMFASSAGLSRVLVGIFSWIVSAVAAPFTYCVMILVYFNIRIRKEGFAVEHLVDQFTAVGEVDEVSEEKKDGDA